MERDVTRRHSKTMNIKKTLPAVAGFFIASAALAAEQFLPTPPPSAYVDAESSVNVPLPTTEGRHIKLTLAFDSSPSNAVQVAFGRDLNGSETLEPEETDLIVGCDCGEPFVRDEVKVRGEGEQRNVQVSFEEQESDHNCSPSPSTFTSLLAFHIRQAQSFSDRYNLAKVTTHNLSDTNLTVTVDFYTKGTALILR